MFASLDIYRDKKIASDILANRVAGNGEPHCHVGTRTKPWSSEKGGSALDCWATSLELLVYIYKYKAQGCVTGLLQQRPISSHVHREEKHSGQDLKNHEWR